MKLVRSRLVAGALGLAVAGTATGSVIASADDTAPVARAAQQGGVSITPASVETTAKRGSVGSITVKNTTRDTMRVTINVRPWIQNRCHRHGRPEHARQPVAVRAGVAADVHAQAGRAPRQLQHAPDDRVGLALRRLPGVRQAGQARRRRNGIIPQWDLRGKMRLNPSRKNPNLRIGATDVVGRGNNRSLILAVRNTGNTLDPVGGTVRITGPTARNATIPRSASSPARSSTSRAARCAA